jgi:hypothetical protein
MIFDLALSNWYDYAYLSVKDRLVDALLNLIASHRLGEQVDHSLLNRTIRTFLQLGINNEQHTHFYQVEFEDHFIAVTEEFFTAESESFLQDNNISSYMKKVEECLDRESDLAEQCLHPLTKIRLIQVCEKVMIQRYFDLFQYEFQFMLRDNKEKDMRRFYHLLSRIEGGLDNSSKTMNCYLLAVGNEIVEQTKIISVKDKIDKSHRLINNLLEFYVRYTEVVQKCFSNDLLFVRIMNKAFREIVNQDVGIFTTAELLNFFVDHCLKGNEKLLEDQLDETLTNVVQLFTHFNEKDMFLCAFRKSLSKRLLGRKINEVVERSFISKLKDCCCDVIKLEGMLVNIKQSTERQLLWKDYCLGLEEPLSVDLSVTVLNDLYWPLWKQTDFQLPTELLPCVHVFEQYYKSQNDAQKLTWLYNQGTCTINYLYVTKERVRKKKELHLSVLQTCISLLFNESTKYTFQEMLDILGVSKEMLRFALYPLVYTKLRYIANRGSKGKGKPKVDGKTVMTINENDIFSIIPMTYPNKRIVYPPGVNIKMEMKGSRQLKKKVNEERDVKMDLVLVRVMKMKNVLDIQELIAEATKQLIRFFKPNPRVMKKRIEGLMERGFMRRDDEETRLIHYCA